MNVATFKSNLRTAALARQADLFARADRIDEMARGLRKHNPLRTTRGGPFRGVLLDAAPPP